MNKQKSKMYGFTKACAAYFDDDNHDEHFLPSLQHSQVSVRDNRVQAYLVDKKGWCDARVTLTLNGDMLRGLSTSCLIEPYGAMLKKEQS